MRLIWLAAMLAALSVTSFASDDIGPVATLNFVVRKDANGKPVRNAAVVLHLVGEKGILGILGKKGFRAEQL